MAYQSLKDKIHNALSKNKTGKRKINLPIKILKSLTNQISLSYVCNMPKEFTSEQKTDEYILENVSGFYLLVSYSKETEQKKKFTLQDFVKEYFLILTVDGVEYKIKVQLDDLDLYDCEKITAMWQNRFEALTAGSLVVAIHPEVYLLKDFSKIFVGGFENTQWDDILHEGSTAIVIEKQKVEDNFFVKILYNSQTFWAFGALFPLSDYSSKNKTQPENHHFI